MTLSVDSITSSNYDSANSITSLLDEYSQNSLLNLKSKRITPTSSPNLNVLFDGGIRSQELIEFFGDDYEANAEFLTHLVFEYLYSDPYANAIVITTNYSQNPYRLYESCKCFLRKFDFAEDKTSEELEKLLKRVYIIPCVSISDLLCILDTIAYNGYTQENSDSHLGLITIHILSSLFNETDFSSTKRDSTTVVIKLREIAHELNCSILVSNFKTHLTNSKEEFDPYLETDNAVFSKLSGTWHSAIDTRIYLTSLNADRFVKITAQVITSRRMGYNEATITLFKTQ
ncbi:hypothetical protein TpMuguga_04g00259 [Theileria parva strain Muguga]|uniref:uncharacterized protein n=1 Tax=Theileria parva strain Muguga TaxID=333668 RepID=UPI001C617C41|nr:uncharacterized protein TpMuguga_04g00259 [Theileria parva strain Muguga]EAN31611.2 hypothetical protein TpMuguga_04g00259 [Theileria parva strain Muguga]